jgi:hypothetical protein
MEAVECRYRGRVIGWLVEGLDGFLLYIPIGLVKANWREYVRCNGAF